MEFTPKNINPERVKEKLLELDGQIKNLHDLHIWEITSGIYCMSAHMTVDDMSVSQTGRLLDKITAVLEKNFNIRHPIIQFETGENANHVSVCNLNGITEKKPH
jgi:cobalt-zinc-cadmium efflux system protein